MRFEVRSVVHYLYIYIKLCAWHAIPKMMNDNDYVPAPFFLPSTPPLSVSSPTLQERISRPCPKELDSATMRTYGGGRMRRQEVGHLPMRELIVVIVVGVFIGTILARRRVRKGKDGRIKE